MKFWSRNNMGNLHFGFIVLRFLLLESIGIHTSRFQVFPTKSTNMYICRNKFHRQSPKWTSSRRRGTLRTRCLTPRRLGRLPSPFSPPPPSFSGRLPKYKSDSLIRMLKTQEKILRPSSAKLTADAEGHKIRKSVFVWMGKMIGNHSMCLNNFSCCFNEKTHISS
jgi:hypothetical protein